MLAGGGVNVELVAVEVELQVDTVVLERYERRAQSFRRNVERNAPGMIQPRSMRKPNLSNDLGPQMKRLDGVDPRVCW